MSGKQIIEYVKAGHIIGDVTFDTWLEQVGADLKFGKNASSELRSEIACLLYALQEVVTKNPKRPGAIAQKIELKDPKTTPVQCRYRRYSPEEQQTIREETQKLLDNGIIKYSDSPWRAPPVLVRKSDGSWRFCINFTATVNPHLRLDGMPMPKPQDILDDLRGAAIMST